MDTLNTIINTKIIAISRGNYGAELFESVEALYRAGIRAVEVTFEASLSCETTAYTIKRLAEQFNGRMCIGAGTVLNVEQVDIARSSGVSFIVSPNVNTAVISRTKEAGLVSIPGAMTATEVVCAYESGADIVKVFPAGALGSAYFRAIKAPLAHIPMAAVGGITPENISHYISAGAVAFGISSPLFPKKLMQERRFEEIERIARSYMDKISVI